MGMFDEVICEYPLPEKAMQGEVFQTKDFDCQMTKYTISSDGRLIREEFHYEDVPKEKRPFPEAPDDSLMALFGCIKRIVDGKTDMNFHGVLNFYGSDKKTDEWFEYNAKFTDGKLVSIERNKDAT